MYAESKPIQNTHASRNGKAVHSLIDNVIGDTPQAGSKNRAIVVGGGLAGLAAATLLAREGVSVTLYERSRHLGGRGASQMRDGFILNQGPHALYRASAGMRVLRSLGIEPQGKLPSVNGGLLWNGRLNTLSASPLSFFTLPWISAGVKLELLTAIARIALKKPASWGNRTVVQMIEHVAKRTETRQLLLMINRVLTYSNQPHLQSAKAAATQWQRGLNGNVLYLDGGWQSLVDGLRQKAEAAGVHIQTEARVTAIERSGQGIRVRLDDGTQQEAATVIIAAAPQVVQDLLGDAVGDALSGWLPRSPVLRMATLDVALERLPNPAMTVVFGVDTPLYFSVHSAAAKLAPAGSAMLHVARYVAADEEIEATEVRAELEQFLDQLQPGWREVVVHERFLPDMTVSHALDLAGDDRLGKSTHAVPNMPGLFVAGDWVGQEGMLVDAALASAETSAHLALRYVQETLGQKARGRMPAQEAVLVGS